MGSHARLQESGAWRFQLFSVATVLVVVALALLPSTGLSPDVLRVANGLGLMAGGLSASLACRYRARRSEGLRRRSWNLWSLACLAAASSNFLLMLNGADAERKTVSPGDIALLLTLVLSASGMISFPLIRRRGTDMVRMFLDGVVIGGSILAVASTQLPPAMTAMSASNAVLNLTIPVIDIMVATLAILMFTRGGSADRLTLSGAAIGFNLFAVSDLLYAVQMLQVGTFQLGTRVDLGWLAGYALIAWTVRHPRAVAQTSRSAPTEISPVRGTATVFAVFLAACVVGVVALLSGEASPVTGAIWAVVLLAVLARQFFLVIDNDSLRRELEQRVIERTRSLRQVTRRSDLVVSSVGDGIYGVDRFGQITFVNPAAAEALGYDPAELIGHDASNTFHAVNPSEMTPLGGASYITEAIRDSVMTSGKEDTYMRADGREIPVEVTATPLIDDGTTQGAVVVFRDVTQRREVDRLKNEFVSMVSHELRTPLTAIRGSLGLLAGGALGPLSPTATRMVEIALVSSDRLTRLINEILDLERMEAGVLPMNIGTYPARTLIDTAMGQATVVAQENGVRLRVLRTEGEVRADADRVVQTLLNLLGNAIKFSDPGGQVSVQATPRGNVVEFQVSDSGRGIPPDKLDAIFARFEQIDSSDAREKGGSGLGLTISRSIVERLGGRIWAENNPDAGAVFRFTLPALPQPPLEPDLPAVPVDEDALRARPAELSR